MTVQNKVEKEEAEETLWKISKRWKDREGEAVGLGLWEYQKDGRWKHVQDYRFGELRRGAPSVAKSDFTFSSSCVRDGRKQHINPVRLKSTQPAFPKGTA